VVLITYLVLIDAPFLSRNLVLVPIAIFVVILLLAGLTLLLSSINVYLRDVQHFLDLVVMAWFWLTPVLYQITLVADRAKDKFWIYLLNPLAPVVLAFQRAFYNMTAPIGKDGAPVPVLLDVGMGWYLTRLGYTALVGAILFVVGLAVFARNEGNFAEEL
jgi:ABC-2 type transport system permease protein